MDTSKEYILMSEEAGEIQEEWNKDLGDVCSVIWNEKGIGGLQGCILQQEPIYGIAFIDNEWWNFNGKFENEHNKTKLENIGKFSSVIWLPRQGQLQEMVKDTGLKKLCGASYISSLYHWFNTFGKTIPYVGEYSMEQLWLAFIMKEKYQKTWDGKEWNKEKEKEES